MKMRRGFVTDELASESIPLVTSVELSTVVAGNHSKVNGTISVLSELLVWKEKKTADGETTSSCCRKRSIKDGQVVLTRYW